MFSVCNLIVLMGFIRSFGRGLFGNFGEKNVEKNKWKGKQKLCLWVPYVRKLIDFKDFCEGECTYKWLHL